MCVCDSNDWVQFEQQQNPCIRRWSNQLSNIPAHLWLEDTPGPVSAYALGDSTCGVIAEVLPDLVNPMVKEMIALGHLAIHCLRSLP